VHRRVVATADPCEQAAKIMKDAGAVSDDNAPRRLLAGRDHQATMITVGSGIPAVAESNTEGLCRALEEINEEL
jgi:hypothetical protein